MAMLAAVAIVASVPSTNLVAVRDLLMQAARVAGCPSPRVAMFSDFPLMRIEVDCREAEEGYL